MGAWVCISRPMGGFRMIPLLTSKELSSWEGFLDSGMKNMWSLM